MTKHQIQPENGDEPADAGRTVEPVSRDEILRRGRGQENIIFPCSRIGNLTRLILTILLYVITINTKYSDVVPTSTVSY